MRSPAGFYIHLPFCASTCAYCTFTTTTQVAWLPRYMQALQREMQMLGRLGGRPLATLYLGGGTPSLVPQEELAALFAALDKHFPRLPTAEVTLEANPDDVSEQALGQWKSLGINRLSLGVQSFSDGILRLLGRRHDAAQAEKAVASALQAGFVVSVDLMLALPGLQRRELADTLARLGRLRPHHVSVYLLEMDKPHRLLALAARRPELFPSEEEACQQYLWVSRTLRQWGYRHYEISNFALPGFYARHNLRYWLGGIVLACGVAAAGQGRRSRWVNTRDLLAYMQALEAGQWPAREVSQLGPAQAQAEKLMLRLRLRWGARWQLVEEVSRTYPDFAQVLETFLATSLARQEKGRLRLLPKGWLLSNELFATLV